jgi:hypothetical protein
MRIFNLVTKSIEVDILTSEEEIERLINSDVISTPEKIESIKKNLDKIINSQLIMSKWVTYSPNPINNENEINKGNE